MPSLKLAELGLKEAFKVLKSTWRVIDDSASSAAKVKAAKVTQQKVLDHVVSSGKIPAHKVNTFARQAKRANATLVTPDRTKLISQVKDDAKAVIEQDKKARIVPPKVTRKDMERTGDLTRSQWSKRNFIADKHEKLQRAEHVLSKAHEEGDKVKVSQLEKIVKGLRRTIEDPENKKFWDALPDRFKKLNENEIPNTLAGDIVDYGQGSKAVSKAVKTSIKSRDKKHAEVIKYAKQVLIDHKKMMTEVKQDPSKHSKEAVRALTEKANKAKRILRSEGKGKLISEKVEKEIPSKIKSDSDMKSLDALAEGKGTASDGSLKVEAGDIATSARQWKDFTFKKLDGTRTKVSVQRLAEYRADSDKYANRLKKLNAAAAKETDPAKKAALKRKADVAKAQSESSNKKFNEAFSKIDEKDRPRLSAAIDKMYPRTRKVQPKSRGKVISERMKREGKGSIGKPGEYKLPDRAKQRNDFVKKDVASKKDSKLVMLRKKWSDLEAEQKNQLKQTEEALKNAKSKETADKIKQASLKKTEQYKKDKAKLEEIGKRLRKQSAALK